jgi:hypothetical protein
MQVEAVKEAVEEVHYAEEVIQVLTHLVPKSSKI